MTKHRALITLGTGLLAGVLAALLLLAPRETDVYAAVLDQFPDDRPLLVSRPGTCSATIDVAGVPASLFQRFLLANRPGTATLSLLPMRWNYDLGLGDLWSGRVPYPGGRRPLYLSRVGYNEDRTEALFCADARGGMLFYLRKEHGTWRLVGTQEIWVSALNGARAGADV